MRLKVLTFWKKIHDQLFLRAPEKCSVFIIGFLLAMEIRAIVTQCSCFQPNSLSLATCPKKIGLRKSFMRLCTHTWLTHLRAGKDQCDNLKQPSRFIEHGKECSEKVSSVLKHTQLINGRAGTLNTSVSIANAHDFSTSSHFLLWP